MIKILCPINLDNANNNVLSMAFQLSKDSNSLIRIVYLIRNDFTEKDEKQLMKSIKIAERQIIKLAKRFPNPDRNLQNTSMIFYNDINLEKIDDIHSFDFISVDKEWKLCVSHLKYCPVIIEPEQKIKDNLKEILVAMDELHVYIQPIKHIYEMFSPGVHFLYFNHNKKLDTIFQKIKNLADDIGISDTSVNILSGKNSRIVQGIQSFINRKNIDMIIVSINLEKEFINILHEIIKEIKVPIVINHHY